MGKEAPAKAAASADLGPEFCAVAVLCRSGGGFHQAMPGKYTGIPDLQSVGLFADHLAGCPSGADKAGKICYDGQ